MQLTSARKHAVAAGALALGAFALGALAVGALAIGRLAVGRARIRRLEVDELVVRKLHIEEQSGTTRNIGAKNDEGRSAQQAERGMEPVPPLR
jgi:hypothetical protein